MDHLLGAHERQPRVHFFPGFTNPFVTRILRIGKGPPATGDEVQVVDIVARTGDDRMITVANQDHVTVACRYDKVATLIGRIQALMRERRRVIGAVVIDFVEVGFVGRMVHIVFVRRVARPVAAGRIDLDRDQVLGATRW